VAEALNRGIELHTCRQHHTMLRHIVNEFPTETPLPGTTMLVLMGRLKSILVRHLRLEDETLYPALSNAGDKNVRSTARQFRLEMGGLMRAFEDFDNRYPTAESIDANSDAFMDEWQSVRNALIKRMDAEDHDLYRDAESYFTSILAREEAN
jgi:hypothetical protein